MPSHKSEKQIELCLLGYVRTTYSCSFLNDNLTGLGKDVIQQRNAKAEYEANRGKHVSVCSVKSHLAGSLIMLVRPDSLISFNRYD